MTSKQNLQRGRLVQLAKRLGLPVPSQATSEAINEALKSSDPEAWLQEHATRCNTQAVPEGPGDSAPAAAAGSPAPADPGEQDLDNCVTVPVPVGEASGVRRSFSKIELPLSNPSHKRAFTRLYHGLVGNGCRLACGRPVSTSADALRWLLERIDKADQA